jgi:tetratricopeptide (TPR) repeat protein/KaiC/GvpD/RAD55 family RecA-like ATPase
LQERKTFPDLNASQAASKLKPGVLAEPVLVGRERELEELMHCLDSVVEGRGKTVFVSGEAGGGKTRLTNEFLRKAREKGVAVLSGWCLSNAAVPYFPFIEAFDAYFSSGSEENLSPQHPEIGADLRQPELAGAEGLGITAWLTGPQQIAKTGKPSTLSPQVWKDQAFAAVAKTLHSISTQEPIILFLEDIHWADSASLALLHYIARAISSEKILVLATFRSEELTADAEGHPHPLVEEMRLMRREDLFKEIKLPNLDQGSVSKIAENMIGGKLNVELAEKLSRESRGNALFVVETLRMLVERKSLVQENRQWQLAVEELNIPSKIKDIILRRLGVLKFNQRRVLDAASVVGENFNVELLSTVLGQDSLEVLETLNVIAQSTSLVCVEGNFYRFDHTKSRQAIYEEIALPLKRGYHSKVAEKLENKGKNEKLPFSEIAYHYGNVEKAARYAMAAGQDAFRSYSNAEAITHFSYVLQAIADAPENAEVRLIALEGLGDAYYANSMFDDAIKTFEILANSQTGKGKLRAYRKEMEAVWFKGFDIDRLMDLVKKAEQYAVSDRLESAYVRHNRARVLLHRDIEASLKEHEETLRIFEEEYFLPKTADLLFGTGTIHFVVGLDEKGLGEMLRGMAMFHEIGDARGEMMVARRGTGYFFLLSGLFQEAASNYERALKIAEKIGAFEDMAFACEELSLLLWNSGNLEGALSQSLKALEYSKKTDAKGTLCLIYRDLVGQYAVLGDLERAEEYFDKLMKMPKEIISYQDNVIAVMSAEAILYAAKSQWKEANEHYEKLLEMIKANPFYSREFIGVEILTRGAYAWALDRQERAEEARIQLEEVKRLTDKVEKRFGHANVQAGLMARREVDVGKEFEVRLDLVNVSRKPGVLVKIEGIIPPDGFRVIGQTPSCSLQDGNIDVKNIKIDAFGVETVKLTLQATKLGTFTLSPLCVYVDDLGEIKTCKPNPITINVQPAQPTFEALPGRVTTGYMELDGLLLGGIPENCAVVLASPSSDERALLIKRFLEAGAEAGETTFYLTAETGNGKALAEKHQCHFYLFLCNPRADAIVQSLPNVSKLKGVENLTEIDIALTKAFRTINSSAVGPKRACIEIVSDALLQHHAVTTRKWLSALLTDLKSKGFTTLAVIDPQMHPQEEARAIISLFDGEIEIAQKETAKGPAKILKVSKLYNQRYLEDELALTKEKLLP